jgi:hypothetical protein
MAGAGRFRRACAAQLRWVTRASQVVGPGSMLGFAGGRGGAARSTPRRRAALALDRGRGRLRSAAWAQREADAALRRAAGRVKGAEPRRAGSTGPHREQPSGKGNVLIQVPAVGGHRRLPGDGLQVLGGDRHRAWLPVGHHCRSGCRSPTRRSVMLVGLVGECRSGTPPPRRPGAPGGSRLPLCSGPCRGCIAGMRLTRR